MQVVASSSPVSIKDRWTSFDVIGILENHTDPELVAKRLSAIEKVWQSEETYHLLFESENDCKKTLSALRPRLATGEVWDPGEDAAVWKGYEDLFKEVLTCKDRASLSPLKRVTLSALEKQKEAWKEKPLITYRPPEKEWLLREATARKVVQIAKESFPKRQNVLEEKVLSKKKVLFFAGEHHGNPSQTNPRVHEVEKFIERIKEAGKTYLFVVI